MNPMKNITGIAATAASAIFLLAIMNSCNCGTQIKGNLSDAGNDTLVVSVFEAISGDLVLKDTVAAANGKFSVAVEDTAMFTIFINSLADEGMIPAADPLILMPGERIRISGTLDAPVYSGSEISEGLASSQEYKAVNDRLRDLYGRARTIADNDTAAISRLNEEYASILSEKDSVSLEFIRNNPDNLASGYMLLSGISDPAKGIEAYDLLGTSVKESLMGETLSAIAESFNTAIIREKNKENIRPGKPAPEFSLKGLDGKEYSLASFRGKYVLLDFWGKWCYWCMKGMPDMKEYYDKYSHRIEFVGIDCGDTEEVWKKTVEEEGLTWTSLYNGDGQDILNAYAVEGFPTKVLVDSEGKIVEVFVGESEDLYNKLDELF